MYANEQSVSTTTKHNVSESRMFVVSVMPLFFGTQRNNLPIRTAKRVTCVHNDYLFPTKYTFKLLYIDFG